MFWLKCISREKMEELYLSMSVCVCVGVCVCVCVCVCVRACPFDSCWVALSFLSQSSPSALLPRRLRAKPRQGLRKMVGCFRKGRLPYD